VQTCTELLNVIKHTLACTYLGHCHQILYKSIVQFKIFYRVACNARRS